jgi:hypothetical protein
MILQIRPLARFSALSGLLDKVVLVDKVEGPEQGTVSDHRGRHDEPGKVFGPGWCSFIFVISIILKRENTEAGDKG